MVRKLAAAFALLCLASAAFAGWPNSGRKYPQHFVYVGPGDIATFKVWYGLRAFSASDRGNKLVNVCNSTGGTDVGCGDLSSDATTGNLVSATISGITCPGVNCTIKTWYDRSGTGADVTQATVANRYTIGTSCTGLGSASLPCATGSATECYVSSLTITQAQPYTLLTAVNFTANGHFQIVFSDPADDIEFGHYSGASTVYEFSGNGPTTASWTDGSWQTLQGVMNGSSSSLTINGSTTGSLNPGTNGYGGVKVSFGTFGSACQANNTLDGTIVEAGIQTGASSSLSTMNSNMRNYWGF